MSHHRLAVLLIIGTFLLSLAPQGESSGKWTHEREPWKVKPSSREAGDLNPPQSEGATLIIGHNNAVVHRKNGHPKSTGAKTIDCGEQDGGCEIEYSIGGHGGFQDGEKILIKFSGSGTEKKVTHGPPDTGTQKLTFPHCGEITVEVTVDPGKNPKDIKSYFEVSPLAFRCCK